MNANTKKITLFSALVSLNVVIWYEVLGFKFAIAVIILALFVILFD